MTATSDMDGYNALPISQPLHRDQPWLSDGTWIAHETLQPFDRLAAKFPHRGRWRIDETGPHRLSDTPVDLNAIVAKAATTLQPCVIEHDRLITAATIGDITDHQVHDQVLEVIDQSGALITFNLAIATPAEWSTPGGEWRVGTLDAAPVLVRVDRKQRIRMVIAAMSTGDET